jgi:hypothetical protein
LSAFDGRTPRHASYALSQRIRKRVEEGFSSLKTIGGREKPHEHPCRLQARRTVADRQGRHMGSRLSHLSGPATDRLWRPPSLPRHRIQRVLDWIHLAGFDEMDEVSGDGSAELLDDGTIEVEFAYHNGDEALLKASGRAIC